MQYLGDFKEDATVDLMWNSNDADGASITRATNGTIRIYKDNSTTEKLTANGITDSEDFDALTGVHHLRIDTSNDTGDTGFWQTGHEYFIVLSAATIDGQTVNACLAQFSIENRNDKVDAVKISGDSTAADNLESDYDGTGYNKSNSTVGTVGALAAQAKADVNAEVDTALADYDPPTYTEMAASFAALNDLSAAQVNAEADQALADYDPPTKAEMDAAFAASGGETRLRTGTAQAGAVGSITLDAGASAVNDYYKHCIVALTGGTGAGQSQIIDSYVGSTKVATPAANFATAPDNTTTFAVLPLGTIPGASAPTAAQVRDAVLNATRTSFDAAGSVGETINNVNADVANKKVANKATGATEIYEDDQTSVRLTRTLTTIDDDKVAQVIS